MKNRIVSFKATLLAFTFLALCPTGQAVIPAPDGGYPGGNTAEGHNALMSQSTGIYNTAVGIFSLLSVSDGNFCTGIGAGALLANTADGNTATGAGSLLSNTTGAGNTADGEFALFSNTEAQGNTAVGADALFNNTIGSFNTATGFGALVNNTVAIGNTADGALALQNNTSGIQNTAIGAQSLSSNLSGSHNTATGFQALFSNTTADANAAYGYQALLNNTGNFNTANGGSALVSNTTGSGNTAIGAEALFNNTAGNVNIALGADAGFNLTTGSNNIDIGNGGAAGESDTIRIGAAQTSTFIAGVHGVTIDPATAATVGVDASGKLGTVVSSRRFKRDIKPMDNASEAILSLKPATFHYKGDSKNTPCFGLVAEEVAEISPDLVVRDAKGEILTVRYDAINSMLLNEFLKEHKAFVKEQCKVEQQNRRIQEQGTTIARLTKQMETVVARLKEHDSEIQKVNDQLQMSSHGTRLVTTDR